MRKHVVAQCGTVRARTYSRGQIPLLQQFLPLNLMSHTHSTSSPSGFHSIIINALEAYEERTKKDIRSHPLAEKLQTCNSPGAILLVLQQQVREINRPQSGDEVLTKWLDPTVKVLYAFIEVLGEGVGLVRPRRIFHYDLHTDFLFILVGILTCEIDLCRSWHPPFSVYPHPSYLRTGNLTFTSQAVRDTRASHGIIVEIFERMEFFFQRLEIYTEVPPTSEMKGIIIKIMVEVFSILAIATKEINRHRMSGFLLYSCLYGL